MSNESKPRQDGMLLFIDCYKVFKITNFSVLK